jgi:ubiquinone/menaquinone biosynthesis C-methylase UbiE
MNGPRRKQERDYYLIGEHARQYDVRTAEGRSLNRQRLAARIVGRYLEHGQVLDIGCGSARMLIEIARQLPAIDFTGIDVSVEMVRLGRVNVRNAALEGRIMLEVVPAEGLERYAHESFDMVMSHGSFSGWLEPSESLLEVRRMLRSGGFLFVRDWCRSAPREALAPYLASARGNPEHIRRIESAYSSSYTEDEFKDLLAIEGMEELESGRDGLWISTVMKKLPTR